jgi:hypothetical protein
LPVTSNLDAAIAVFYHRIGQGIVRNVTFVTILANPLIAAFIDVPIPLISLLK